MVYQRLWNPTVARFEDALAELENTDAAVAFASGMAAFTAALLAAGADGNRHVVAVRPIYGGSDHLLASGLLGTTVTWTTPDGIAAALRPDTGLVVVETPANPDLRLRDLAAIRRQCRRCRCWSTTRSRRRCCSSPQTSAPTWCCTRRPSSSAAMATSSPV